MPAKRSGVVAALAAGAVLAVAGGASAQDGGAGTTVGVQYAALRLDVPDETRSGVGGWVSIDLARWMSVDASLSVWPGRDDITGRQVQLLAGARAGWRTGRLGIFGRVRPGFVHFTDRFIAPGTVCILIFPTPESCLIDKTNFALDLGGSVEVYPARALVVRVDAGNTMIRFARDAQPAEWTNNLQVTAGVGWRF